MPTPTGPRSLAGALEWLRKRFRADAAEGLCVAYQMDLRGDGGGLLHVRVDDGRLEAGEGPAGDADVVFRLAAADFYAVLAGAANPDLLYMDGELEIEGDLSLALKLRTLFGARL